MIGMGRYRRDAEVAPFSRDLLDQVVRALLDAVEEVPITERGFVFGEAVLDGLRLVEGRHLAAGARYRGGNEELDVEVHVPAWNRVGESRIDVTVTSDGHVVNLRLDLRMSGRRLHTVGIAGDYQGPKPFRWLRRARWEGELRAEEWWSALGSKTSPVSLRVVHPFAHADLQIGRRKDVGGRWSVRANARFGGRSLLRPVAAVGLAVMRGRVRRMLDEGFTKAVAAWNAEVPGMVEQGMRERLEFEHRITLKAVPREWADAYAAALQRGIEGLPFERGRLVKDSEGSFGVELLKGKHIKPGAKYRIDFVSEDEVEPLYVHVVAWEFDGPSRIEFDSPDDVQTGWVEIDSARIIRAGLAGEFKGYTSVKAAAEADLGRWWSGGSPLTATAENPAGEAALTVERVAERDGEWTLNIAATVEGRVWARHLVAVAGVLSGPSMRRSFQENADAFAEKWNGAVGTAEEAADSTLRAVLDH
ncbi:hypothetical protein [Actinomadura sp. BRA 177]|uniref:hypothetical protein n=1 Tax=Actinomadura sp. BRA 177 TaxID=2745202 RepID=UPI0015957228|nr:hypothetical protein [Actinomadura sp. BRA 177]NVI89002.1 hypothetical protein [Actinomadura sp. BRA 177]